MAMISDGVAVTLRKLNAIARLSAQEEQAVASLAMRLRRHGREETIVHEGDRPDTCFAVVEGIIARAKFSGAGKRQIVSINVPGDIPDLNGFTLQVMDHSIVALSDVTVMTFPHSELRVAVEENPNLGYIFWRETTVDAAVTRSWLFNVGRQRAEVRLSHLLCEMFSKLEAVGLVRGMSFQFPLTQQQIADALGLSLVHVNRSLRVLRRDDVVEWRGATVSITDWDRLAELGEFDPTYLHLKA